MIILTLVNGTTYPIDVAEEERLSYEADVTSSAIEKGADTTDNVRPKLPVLDVDCTISDTPVGKVALDPSRQGVSSAAADGFRRLVEIYMTAEPLTVECSFGRFEDMVLEKFSPVRNKGTGKALKFTATFRNIKIVQNERTTVRRGIPNGGHRVNRGLQTGLKTASGHEILNYNKGIGKLGVYRDDQGNVVSREEVVDAAHRSDAVAVNYDRQNGAVPIDSKDYTPYQPSHRNDPWWTKAWRKSQADQQPQGGGR